MKGNMNEEIKVVRKHVERRVKLNDTYIKKLRPLDRLFSVGDSESIESDEHNNKFYSKNLLNYLKTHYFS